MKKEHEVFKILDRETDEVKSVHGHSYASNSEFGSINSARASNVNGVYKDAKKYKIAKYKVTYELIDDDCDAEHQSQIFGKEDGLGDILEGELHDADGKLIELEDIVCIDCQEGYVHYREYDSHPIQGFEGNAGASFSIYLQSKKFKAPLKWSPK